MWMQEPVCGLCRGCILSKKGCEEQTRLCSEWGKVENVYIQGSVVTGVSQVFDLARGDLTKYKSLLGDLANAGLDVEEVLEKLPEAHESRTNARYCRQRRDEEYEVEESSFTRMEKLLRRHAELKERLAELEPLNSADNDDPGSLDKADLMSRTQTAQGLQKLLPLPGEWGSILGDGRASPSRVPDEVYETAAGDEVPDRVLFHDDPSTQKESNDPKPGQESFTGRSRLRSQSAGAEGSHPSKPNQTPSLERDRDRLLQLLPVADSRSQGIADSTK